MAGGALALTPAPDKNYPHRHTFYAWFVMLLAGCGGLLLGYDNGVVGGIVDMGDWQAKFFPDVYVAKQVEGIGSRSPYCKYNNHVLQLFVSSLYIPAALVSIFAASFARKTGRKLPLFIAGVLFLVGAIVMAAANSIAELVVGRVLLGVGVGISSLIVPMYNSECAPPRLRGSMGGLFQLNVTVGILAAGLLNYGAGYIKPDGWRLPLGLAGVPGLIVLAGGIILPDSPASLIERGHLVKARKVMVRVRGVDDVDEEFQDLIECVRLSNMVKRPWANLFKPQYRPQLVTSAAMMLFQQWTGINAIIFYSSVFFTSLGRSERVSLENTCIIGAVNVLSTLLSIILVDRLGRKPLLIAGAVQCLVAHVVLAAVLATQFGKYGVEVPHHVSVGVVVLLCVFINGFAWSWGPIAWVLPTEVQPLETRAAGASLNTACNMLWTFVVGQTFVSMLCAMRWGVFLFFSGMLVLAILFVALLLPETRGTNLESTYQLFQEHWFWRRFAAIREVHMEPLPWPLRSKDEEEPEENYLYES